MLARAGRDVRQALPARGLAELVAARRANYRLLVGTSDGKPIFISFSSVDLAAATAVSEALGKRGIGSFLSSRDIEAGHNYGKEIVRAVKACHAMVVLMSPSASTSEHVRREVTLAVEHRKQLLPFSLNGLTADGLGEDWAYWFSAVQLVEFTTGEAVAERTAKDVTVDRTMKLVKIADHAVHLVEVAKDGSARERKLPRSGDESWAADVTVLPHGGLRITVGGYDLRATKQAPHSPWLTGVETGPDGESTFHVVRIATELPPPQDFARHRWLLIGRRNRPSVIDFPPNVGGRLARQYFVDDLHFSHGALEFVNITNGVLRLEFTLPLPNRATEEAWVKSHGTSLRGFGRSLYPIIG
jgi:hypothetical protein